MKFSKKSVFSLIALFGLFTQHITRTMEPTETTTKRKKKTNRARITHLSQSILNAIAGVLTGTSTSAEVKAVIASEDPEYSGWATLPKEIQGQIILLVTVLDSKLDFTNTVRFIKSLALTSTDMYDLIYNDPNVFIPMIKLFHEKFHIGYGMITGLLVHRKGQEAFPDPNISWQFTPKEDR